MWIKHVLIVIMGISAGFLVAGGMFTVLFTVGLIPRFAGKTRTGCHVKIYETAVIIGSTFWNLVSLYQFSLPFGSVLMASFGFFGGIFVGSLALAIAEMLNGLPIFARRIDFRRGLGIAVLSLAIGKGLGNLLSFWIE